MTRNALGLAALASTATLSLAGCGAAQPEIVTATEDRVSYSWDTDESSLEEVTELAKVHCRQSGRSASLLSNSAASRSGSFFTTIYDCVLP
jgi:hypothetical protein